MTYELTEEGLKYLRQGLPERNLIELLEKPIELKEAQKKVENFSIALQWGKKKGWIKIEEGRVYPLRKPEAIPEEEALKRINEGREVEGDILSVLLSRKLVREVREDIFRKAERYAGKEVTHLTEELIKTGVWRKVKFKPYQVEVPGKRIFPGKRQPYQQFVEKIKRKLVELGFKEMIGPLVETEFWNFDALYQPQDHPARDWASTYQLKYPRMGRLPEQKIVDQVKSCHEDGWVTGSTGWGYRWDPKQAMRLLPRAHGTCLSARTLASGPESPGKYFAIARCYRPDVLDATHLIEFNQAEGIVIDESLNLKNLLGILEIFAKEIAGAEKVKFLPDYYPFTEPSVQLSAYHPRMGWMEFGGSGIFREELTRPLGVDIPVIAWGIGIDRLAMFKLGVRDIRYLFSQDLSWLRESKMVI
jgi:phenylalanyl-tRNA synthetase alpha chain